MKILSLITHPHVVPCNVITTSKALNFVVITSQSIWGQKALGFHQKYLNLCSEDEQRSYGFTTTWGTELEFFWWTVPLRNTVTGLLLVRSGLPGLAWFTSSSSGCSADTYIQGIYAFVHLLKLQRFQGLKVSPRL